MKSVFYAGSAALALALCYTAPASAQKASDNTIRVEHQLLTPSAATINDHIHDGGEVMLGLRFTRERSSGLNQRGTGAISDADILAAGFTARVASMEMDMLMLDVMFAPTDNLTLMVMPHYMWHRMEMVGIDPANTGTSGAGHGGSTSGGHSHAGVPFGEVHGHETQGFGDTLVSASYKLANGPGLRAHATLGVWVPTGAVDRRNADGTFVHYGMQSGSGTWDIEPALTISGQADGFGWGGQASYRWRSEVANSSGFAFGDVFRSTAWFSHRLTADLGVTARAEFASEGTITGHYNGPHNHAAPPDRQANYGGDVLEAGLGLNWRLPTGGKHRPQLGAEVLAPLYQDLNGIQPPRDWRLAISLAQTF